MNGIIGAVEMANATETQIAHYRAICIEKFGAQEAFGKPYQMHVKRLGEVQSLTAGSKLSTAVAQFT
jgi:hypothetical protein